MKISKLNVIHLNTESSSSNVQIIRFSFYHNVTFPNLRSFLFLYCQDESRVIFVTMQQSEIKHIHQRTIVYFHNIFMTVFMTVNNRKSNSELEFQGCSHAETCVRVSSLEKLQTCYVLRSYVTNCLYERKFICPPPTNRENSYKTKNWGRNVCDVVWHQQKLKEKKTYFLKAQVYPIFINNTHKSRFWT